MDQMSPQFLIQVVNFVNLKTFTERGEKVDTGEKVKRVKRVKR